MRKGYLHETYNIGIMVNISIHDIYKRLIRIMKRLNANPKLWMEHLEDGTFDDSRYPIDFTKLKKLG
jgi:dTDP-D-glucose 4,6-dehydratase